MLKKLIVIGASVAMILGCAVKKPETITERFVIFDIDKDNYVHGEIIPDKDNQTGEGIYYSVEELKNAGLKHVEVGDEISVTWTKYSYENEIWENIYNASNED